MKTTILAILAAALLTVALHIVYREGYDFRIANIGSGKVSNKAISVTNYVYTARAVLEKK